MNNAINFASEHKDCYVNVKQLLGGKVFSFKRDNQLSILAVKKVDFPELEKIDNTARLQISRSSDYIFMKSEDPHDIVEQLNKFTNTLCGDNIALAVA